ncbi:hypothetical protein J1614_009030, partial [Plenodomus biglobosus]
MALAATFQALATHLAKDGYSFVCPSPETQGRVVQKRSADVLTRDAKTAVDFFGWNLPCSRQVLSSLLPDAIFSRLEEASIITKTNTETYHSTIRISNFYLPNLLPCSEANNNNNNTKNLYYIHSSYPTAAADAVFFGPDTYLFIPFLSSALQHHLSSPPTSILDVCCGAGAGAIHLARAFPQAHVLGLDLNPRALQLGAINAQLAAVNVEFLESNLFTAVASRASSFDLIVSNPPYIASSASVTGRDLPIYADGGAGCGLDLSIRIVEEGVGMLVPGGVIVVYTGVAVPSADPGHDAFFAALKGVQGVRVVEYRVLHPDMWAEEIGKGAYAQVGRIQVVGAVLQRIP